MARVGRELAMGRWLTLEHKDLAIGEQQSQMIVGPAAAQPQLEDRSLKISDQALRRQGRRAVPAGGG